MALIYRFLYAGIITFLSLSTCFADDDKACPTSFSLLINSCKTPITAQLRVLPNDAKLDEQHLLSVTGAYSSGDRFGIEGLVIHNGKLISRRYQSWDGVLVIDSQGVPKLFNAHDVLVENIRYNLKEKASREQFIKKAIASDLSVIQSHLLISNGELDLNEVDNAPRFKRRLLVSFADGNFAIWETKQSETLYDAAANLLQEVAPEMALNLDMGAYDYCKKGPIDKLVECGGLLVSKDKLTNVLIFSKKSTE